MAKNTEFWRVNVLRLQRSDIALRQNCQVYNKSLRLLKRFKVVAQ